MISKVLALQQQLLSLGYHQFQIDNIIRESVGTSELQSLDEGATIELIAELESYLDFATKCHKKRV